MTVDYWEAIDGSTAYDYFGSSTPEEATLPMSYWTKERILEYLNDCSNPPVNREILQALKRFNLTDLRACALMFAATMPTGSMRSMSYGGHEWRNTTFYRLDLESVNTMF